MAGPFDMARRDDESCCGEAGAQCEQRVGQNFLLALVRAAGQQDRIAGAETEVSEERTEIARLSAGRRGVVFDAARDVPPLRSDAEMLPEFGVRGFLESDGGESSGHRTQQAGEAPVAPGRARRDTSIDQHDGQAAVRRLPDKVRPHFALGQDDGARLHEVEGAADDRREIDRGVNRHPPILLPLHGERMGRRCGAGNDELPCRIPAVQFLEEFEGDEQLSHADRVDPDPFAVAETFAQAGRIPGEALAEVAAEAAAPEHPPEVAGENDDQGEGEKEIVEEARHASGVRR